MTEAQVEEVAGGTSVSEAAGRAKACEMIGCSIFILMKISEGVEQGRNCDSMALV